jgi:hypothetical protein
MEWRTIHLAWKNVLDKEFVQVKADIAGQTVILEVNDGGITPSYVTVHLQVEELDELIAALLEAKRLAC